MDRESLNKIADMCEALSADIERNIQLNRLKSAGIDTEIVSHSDVNTLQALNNIFSEGATLGNNVKYASKAASGRGLCDYDIQMLNRVGGTYGS